MFDGLLNSIGTVLFEFYISVALVVFAPFNCYAPLGSKSSMESFPAILCGEGDHNIMVALSVLGILASLVNCFALTFIATWMYPTWASLALRLICKPLGEGFVGVVLFSCLFFSSTGLSCCSVAQIIHSTMFDFFLCSCSGMSHREWFGEGVVGYVLRSCFHLRWCCLFLQLDVIVPKLYLGVGAAEWELLYFGVGISGWELLIRSGVGSLVMSACLG